MVYGVPNSNTSAFKLHPFEIQPAMQKALTDNHALRLKHEYQMQQLLSKHAYQDESSKQADTIILTATNTEQVASSII